MNDTVKNDLPTADEPFAADTPSLIPVFNTDIGGTVQAAVDARVLHQYLGMKWDFSSWIKKRIADYGFVENQDFISILQMQDGYKTDKNGRVIDQKGRVVPVEFTLTLSTAKELAMVEKNAKGRDARRYFIACEQRFIEQLQSQAQADQTPPARAPETVNGFEMSELIDTVQPLALERALFLYSCQYVPFLNDPALPADELKLRWVCLRSYIEMMVQHMCLDVRKVGYDPAAGLDANIDIACDFIMRWEPHNLVTHLPFPETKKRHH